MPHLISHIILTRPRRFFPSRPSSCLYSLQELPTCSGFCSSLSTIPLSLLFQALLHPPNTMQPTIFLGASLLSLLALTAAQTTTITVSPAQVPCLYNPVFQTPKLTSRITGFPHFRRHCILSIHLDHPTRLGERRVRPRDRDPIERLLERTLCLSSTGRNRDGVAVLVHRHAVGRAEHFLQRWGRRGQHCDEGRLSRSWRLIKC